MFLKIHKGVNNWRTTLFLMVFLLGFSAAGSAQTLDQAREMIKAGDYPAAKAAFEVLIQKYPKRADVNKWYGEALFETGEYAQSRKYLEFAAKSKIQGAYLYLGKLNQREYRFDDAIANLEKYRALLKKQPEAVAALDTLIEQCELGSKALNRIEKVQIIDSMIVSKNNFFEYYKLSQETGHFIDYRTLAAADPNQFTVVFESQRGDRRVYARKAEQKGYELYTSNKLHGDDWSEPVPFPDNINTAANENFPFVLTDGLTLYYASDMNPTLGGYDLYITRYDTSNEMYFTPERLPMPFNSPFNDYLMAIDESNNVGWFATDRFQPQDKVIIYLFIPNQGEKEYYRDLAPAEAISLARIDSIRATWPEDASYDQLLYSIYNEQQKVTKERGDFVFVINDNIVYLFADDFESTQARELFAQSQQAKKQLEGDNRELDTLREQWNRGDERVRNKIRSRILQLEEKTEQLQQMVPQLEMKARNTEILYLRNK